MFHSGCVSPSAFAFSLTSLPTSLTNLIASDLADHSPCLPRGYPPFCPPFGMGRLDCLSLHNSDYGEWGGDLRHAKNAREPKGTEEENSAEC